MSTILKVYLCKFFLFLVTLSSPLTEFSSFAFSDIYTTKYSGGHKSFMKIMKNSDTGNFFQKWWMGKSKW